jgi:hypothetical protein
MLPCYLIFIKPILINLNANIFRIFLHQYTTVNFMLYLVTPLLMDI